MKSSVWTWSSLSFGTKVYVQHGALRGVCHFPYRSNWTLSNFLHLPSPIIVAGMT